MVSNLCSNIITELRELKEVDLIIIFAPLTII